MAASTSVLSKFRGAMVGALVGDCLGSFFEGQPALSMLDLLKSDIITIIEDNHGKDAKDCAKCEYTDDTAMARSVAGSLIACKGLDAKDMAKRFTEEYYRQPGRGYGANVVNVFRMLRETDYSDVFRPASEQFGGSGSYGNGGAMRIVPAALFGYRHQKDALQDLVNPITMTTHSHVHAIHGALLQCHAVHIALRQENTVLNKQQFIDDLLEVITPLEKEQAEKHKDCKSTTNSVSQADRLPYTNKLNVIKSLLEKDTVKAAEVEDKLGTDVSALNSVPTAIFAFLHADRLQIEDRHHFEKTILYAISLGGDTDTIATMAGAIAGAYYGIDSVPTEWQNSCESIKDAKVYAQKLYDMIETSV